MPEETPKIHIDSDWKAEARAEKERLADASTSQQAEGGTGGSLPGADFKSLVGLLASQAVMGLGALADPKTKGVVIDLEGARFSIELLAMLEEKTKGNLDPVESEELAMLLRDLRARYVQVADMASRATKVPTDAPGGGETPGS